MQIPIKKQGDQLLAAEINELNSRTQAQSVIGGNGVQVASSGGGIAISARRGRAGIGLTNISSICVLAMSEEEMDTLPRFSPVEITTQFYTDIDKAKNSLVVKIKKPTSLAAGRFGVCQEPIAPGALGKIIIDGLTLVNVVNWLGVSSSIFSKADIFAPNQYLIALPNGSADILWEDTFTGNAEHLALVKLNANDNTLTQRFLNAEGSTIELGQPIQPDIDTFTTGLDTNKKMQMKLPGADIDKPIYVASGGSTLNAAEGIALAAQEPFIARVDQAVEANDKVGVKISTGTFVKDEEGFLVLAYLGELETSKFYALIQREGGGGISAIDVTSGSATKIIDTTTAGLEVTADDPFKIKTIGTEKILSIDIDKVAFTQGGRVALLKDIFSVIDDSGHKIAIIKNFYMDDRTVSAKQTDWKIKDTKYLPTESYLG